MNTISSAPYPSREVKPVVLLHGPKHGQLVYMPCARVSWEFVSLPEPPFPFTLEATVDVANAAIFDLNRHIYIRTPYMITIYSANVEIWALQDDPIRDSELGNVAGLLYGYTENPMGLLTAPTADGSATYSIPSPRPRPYTPKPPRERPLDEDGYYDSSGEWWQDAHHYVPSDTDEVLKLIDETLS